MDLKVNRETNLLPFALHSRNALQYALVNQTAPRLIYKLSGDMHDELQNRDLQSRMRDLVRE